MVEGVEGLAGEFSPAFNSRGKLASGIHPLSWEDFFRAFVYNRQREFLVAGLVAACTFLRAAGCVTVYVGGSFTTIKRVPEDIDVIWKSEEVRWRYLRAAAPVFFEMTPGNPRQKRLFRGEFFPSEGIESESGLNFLEFFQRDRQRRRRGLAALDCVNLPRVED